MSIVITFSITVFKSITFLHMPGWVIESNWVVVYVRKTIPTLRVRWVRNDGIWLNKVVNIRRSPPTKYSQKWLAIPPSLDTLRPIDIDCDEIYAQ